MGKPAGIYPAHTVSKKGGSAGTPAGPGLGIMYKAARNKPLTPAQRIINKLISSARYKVEQSIGTSKRGYHFFRMRYKGLDKGNTDLLLNAMAFNLKKAAAMIE